jgi:hypothetical protein
MSHLDPTAEQISAELADHLAASAGELERRGIPAADAEAQAREKFGDVSAVSRQCYWVQQGDTIMFRRVTIALVVLLCVGLIATTANSWLAQSRLTQQLAQLNEQLASLTKTQETLQDRQKPLSITGLIYDGDKSKPVANHEVGIARLNDSAVVRRIKTDSRGIYDSGPLAAGDYFVFGTLTEDVKLSGEGLQFVQGPPQYLYAGVGEVNADLDASYRPTGRIALKCSPPLQSIDVENRYRIVPSLMLTASSGRWRSFPWHPNRPQPPQWPLYVSILNSEGERADQREPDRVRRPSIWEIMTVEELNNLEGTLLRDPTCYFPDGNVYIGGLLVTDIVPLTRPESAIADKQPVSAKVGSENFGRREALRFRLGGALAQKWIMSMPDVAGTALARQMAGNPSPSFAPIVQAQQIEVEAFTIASGEELRLRVELPPDWDAEIRAAVNSAKSVQELLIKLNQGKTLFQQVSFSRIESK